jgi:serine/threonine protein phosphatase PrpC
MAELIWGAATHPGQIRTGNEDNFWASPTMFVVADGMGGHQAGEVASLIATQHLQQVGDSPDPTDLVRAIQDANLAIHLAATNNVDQQGMGTTVTSLAVIADPTTPDAEKFVLANVGDSRSYLLREGRLSQLSEDHSYVQALVNEGHITIEEARVHPRRNIVTRALGIEDDVEVDSWILPIVRGDRFLLCSDGLVDEVDDAAIAEILIRYTDPQAAAEELVDVANANGGRDNVTVVIVDVVDGDDPSDTTGEIDLTSLAATITEELPMVPTSDLPDEALAPVALAASAATPRSRSPRLTLGRFLSAVAAGAVIVVSVAVFAAWARSGYYVAFDDGEQVTIYKGRAGGVLWFDPTVESPTALNRDLLDEASIALVEDQRRFNGLKSAQEFVGERLSTTTTTTTTMTTTTTTTTTTIPDDNEDAENSANSEEEQTSRTAPRTGP